jgi:hypothetical protein
VGERGNKYKNGIGNFIFINMLPSHLLFPRLGISRRGGATFVAIYNLPPGNNLEIIDDIAATLELYSLFPTPRYTQVDTWRENRVAFTSPSLEDEANNPSPAASQEINTCDTFESTLDINDVFPNDASTPNLKINETDNERKGIFYISPWLASQTESQKCMPIPTEDMIWKAFKEMCKKQKM